MSGLSASVSQEIALQERIFSFYDDPLGYNLYVLPWGVKGGPLADFSGPDDWQAEQMTRIGDAVRANPDTYRIKEAIASGHGIGKTFQQAAITHWHMSTRPMQAGRTTAGTATQLKTTTWRELKKFNDRSINGHWFNWTATNFERVGYEGKWFQSAQPNTEHNSESFAGLHEGAGVLIIVDEASKLERAVFEVMHGATTEDRYIWLMYGNPTRNSGPLRETFGKLRNYWVTRSIDSRDSMMATRSEAAVKQFEDWIEQYGEDSDFIRVRVRGLFPSQSSVQFIASDVVEAAQQRTHKPDLQAPRIMGVDVARYGDDASMIAMVQGRKLYPLKELRNQDLMTVASWVGAEIKRFRPDVVYIDAVGLGSGVVDRLRMLGFEIVEVHGGAQPSEEYRATVVNKRAECWTVMREWLSDADIPADDRALVEDLTSVEYMHNRVNMKLQLEAKEDMKKRGLSSPDRADALSYCFAFPYSPAMADEQTEPEATASY